VLLLRVSGAVDDRSGGAVGFVARACDHRLDERMVTLGGGLRARVMVPRGAGPWRAVVVAHGVHRLGIDEPRTLAFVRALARGGVAVVTPQLDDLADYRVAPATVGEMRESVAWAASQPWAQGHRAGLVGLSFGGGLALIAATDPALRGRLSFVASLGGHHELARVGRFLALDPRAHPYGVAVFAYANAERLVEPGTVVGFRAALGALLRGDRRAAEASAAALSGDAAWLAGRLLAGDRAAVAPRLAAALPGMAAAMAAASPAGRLGGVRVPVYLLHGAHDDVIPPSEARFAESELGRRVPVRVLLTSVVDHVTVQRSPTARERWDVVHFWASML
jgi:dienelactone hydrolase